MIPVERFQKATCGQAIAAVDQLLGPSGTWQSKLIRYRLESDFQGDWKEEVGHWLLTAQELGFVDELISRAIGRAKESFDSAPDEVKKDTDAPNDLFHRILQQELAPAMLAHYLVGTGWAFHAWEPAYPSGIDVDLIMATPDGSIVAFQVKAPDKPGRVVLNRIHDGENDQHVIAAIYKAAQQLPQTGSEAKMIVVCAQRTWPLSGSPRPLVSALIGSTLQLGSQVTLPCSKLGLFFTSPWRHVSGTVLLDLVRSEKTYYGCTVLLNPIADVKASRTWFGDAHVSWFDGQAFRWQGGGPGIYHTLPDGTMMT